MSPDELGVLLHRLAPALDALTEPWSLIGSGALIVAGAAWPACDDADILTTETGAAALEQAWAGWRDPVYAPDPLAPFRSRFSRYDFAPGKAEVMGGLMLRAADGGWSAVEVRDLRPANFAGRAWPVPSLSDQARILKSFGRPKDLEKAAFLAKAG